MMQTKADDRRFLNGVRVYYDKNTPRFVKSHQSSVAKAIHREVWGPQVENEKEAFEYVNRLILDVISETAGSDVSPIPVLDLGCGVGGTLFYLAERLRINATGVTLSPVGRILAEQLAQSSGLEKQCRFIEANYLDLPDFGPFAAAYAVESFLHGPDPARFFRSAASVMIPGACLMICDDFLTAEGEETKNRTARRYLSDFKRGWHVGTLITSRQAQAYAADAGLALIDDRELTSYLKLQRPCDRLIAAFVRLGRGIPFRSPWWDSWVGGHAIQQCLLTGLVQYRFLIFEKVA